MKEKLQAEEERERFLWCLGDVVLGILVATVYTGRCQSWLPVALSVLAGHLWGFCAYDFCHAKENRRRGCRCCVAVPSLGILFRVISFSARLQGLVSSNRWKCLLFAPDFSLKMIKGLLHIGQVIFSENGPATCLGLVAPFSFSVTWYIFFSQGF